MKNVRRMTKLKNITLWDLISKFCATFHRKVASCKKIIHVWEMQNKNLIICMDVNSPSNIPSRILERWKRFRRAWSNSPENHSSQNPLQSHGRQVLENVFAYSLNSVATADSGLVAVSLGLLFREVFSAFQSIPYHIVGNQVPTYDQHGRSPHFSAYKNGFRHLHVIFVTFPPLYYIYSCWQKRWNSNFRLTFLSNFNRNILTGSPFIMI